MSVLIRGMEMPKSCLECSLYNDPWCMAKNRSQWRTAYNRPLNGERQNDCPLIPVPDHGDLIDRDALTSKRKTVLTGIGSTSFTTEAVLMADIKNAPTIYAEEVYDKYTDTAGNLHWTGTHSGKHIVKAEKDET